MSYKRMAAAQHMNAEVAAMSAMVFSQYTHLVDMGSMVGYGESDKAEPFSDDPMESLVLELLELTPGASGVITKQQVELVMQRHAKAVGNDNAIMAAWNRKRV